MWQLAPRRRISPKQLRKRHCHGRPAPNPFRTRTKQLGRIKFPISSISPKSALRILGDILLIRRTADNKIVKFNNTGY